MTFPNQQMHNPWTEPRLALLKKLHFEGLSFSYMAAQIGLSRCACIGKAHRIGLPRRKKTWAKTKTSIPRPLKHNNTNKLRALLNGRTYGPTDLEPEIAIDPIGIIDPALKLHHCRWPVSGHGLGIMFCGRDVACDTSYCAKHLLMAYQKPSKSLSRAKKEVFLRRLRKKAA